MERDQTNLARHRNFGRNFTVNTGIVARGCILSQETKTAHFYISLGARQGFVDKLAAFQSLLKTGFDTNQDRDENGRWSNGNSSRSSDETHAVSHADLRPLAPALAVGEAGFFVTAGEVTLVALAEVALPVVLVGAAIYFGVLFIRSRKNAARDATDAGNSSSAVVSGTIRDRPDINYEYDHRTGYVILSQADGAPIFSGAADRDGAIRDPGGVIVGHQIDGGIAMDADILPATSSETETGVNAGVKAVAVEETSDPQLCPDPTPDRPGGKSARSVLYQSYINTLVNPTNPLPPGLAVRLINPATRRWVTFDDCYQNFGTMVEAKGQGYGEMYGKNNARLSAGIDAYLLKQAGRQVSSAGLRGLEWDFAEGNAADRARALFAGHGYRQINVRNIPFPLN